MTVSVCGNSAEVPLLLTTVVTSAANCHQSNPNNSRYKSTRQHFKQGTLFFPSFSLFSFTFQYFTHSSSEAKWTSKHSLLAGWTSDYLPPVNKKNIRLISFSHAKKNRRNLFTAIRAERVDNEAFPTSLVLLSTRTKFPCSPQASRNS